MATVLFTSHLREHAPDAPLEVEAENAADALREALRGRDRLRSYVLDERGRLRRHVALFIDGRLAADRVGLSDPVRPESELYVMQALSGG